MKIIRNLIFFVLIAYETLADANESLILEINKEYKVDFKALISTEAKPLLDDTYKAGSYKFHLEKKIPNSDLIVMVKGDEDLIHSPILIISNKN